LKRRRRQLYWRERATVPVRFARQNPHRRDQKGRWRPGRPSAWKTFGSRASMLTGKPWRSCGQTLLMPRLAALRVRRGRGRGKWLCSKSRAPGYPPDSRANFGAMLSVASTSAAGECAGASFAARFAPRSPASRPLRRETAENPSWSRAGAPTGPTERGGRAPGPTASTADARGKAVDTNACIN
jgi:hypothetical protein